VSEGRSNWYLLTGLILGIAFGLIYAWAIDPVQYVDISPASLKPADKESYRALVALAYQANRDVNRARARLALLNDANPALAISQQAERWQVDKATAREAKALALLAGMFVQPATTAPQVTPSPSPTRNQTAAALLPTGTQDPGQVVRTATQPATLTPTPTLTPSRTPLVTFTPRYTQLSSPTQGAPFMLKEKKSACEADKPGWLQIEVLNARGEPLPGIRIQITWNDRTEYFYTGFAPEISLGYADFVMEPKTVYSLQVGQGAETVTGITPPDCLVSSVLGGWKLKFQP